MRDGRILDAVRYRTYSTSCITGCDFLRELVCESNINMCVQLEPAKKRFYTRVFAPAQALVLTGLVLKACFA